MKQTSISYRARALQRGWASLAVMTLAGAGLMLLAGVVNRPNENSTVIARNNEAVATATEKVPTGRYDIPLFQFAIFYQNDMEICPGGAMTIRGPVHGNANVYLQPQSGLTFSNTVSAVDSVVLGKSPLDPTSRTATTGNPPIGARNIENVGHASQSACAILQLPRAGQTPASASGESLLYNQADMIIIISSNNTIQVTSGAFVNNQATVISENQWQAFLSTNGAFYNQRENLTVNPVTLNISNLVNWSATNNILRPLLSSLRGGGQADIQSIYVADLRSTSNRVITTNYTVGADTTCLTNWVITGQPGVVLSNGAVLPPQGLSIATPDPAYIVGNWNIRTNFAGVSDAGSSDTSHTRPSAIYADAIHILSPAWNPANSALAIDSRNATSDTVNSAFLTGNVPSDGSDYSGGVENFPRFLENWSGQTFTYNGSMVCLFSSQIATAPWPGSGSVYNPPTRAWAFDNNFTDPNKQPPLMPKLLAVQPNKWVLAATHTTRF